MLTGVCLLPPTWIMEYSPIFALNAPTISDIEAGGVILPKNTEVVPEKPLKPNQSDLELHLAQYFAEYGIYDKLYQAQVVIQCESGWDIFADNGISYGIAQFTEPTWQDFGIGDIKDPYAQLETMAYMWSIGLESRWDCWRFIFN